MAPSAPPRFRLSALGQGQQAGALGIEHFDATVLGAAGSAGVVRARHVGTDPSGAIGRLSGRWRRKIAATDWACLEALLVVDRLAAGAVGMAEYQDTALRIGLGHLGDLAQRVEG